MGEGVVDFIFETRGENVVVKIYNAAWNQTCERNVIITSDVVKLLTQLSIGVLAKY